jgi:hypothetical protein
MAHLFAQTAAPGRRAAAMKNKKQKPPCRSRLFLDAARVPTTDSQWENV